ncbi:hypothetical protein HK103_002942 [Boothiomyces macroporosus]|uniref:CAP-Gly domain-containing protein n=1 Tax=Boothiomyces macroporosus TaxID=261099 RepID=A0AAD5UKR6_9FUNG|nr:hypothetical protein HK103_002942 [Boothiomyces macroporosus]
MASRPPSRPASRLSMGKEVEVEKGENVVILSNGLTGTVKFKGTTNFATGNWIGIELDEPAGKNDGSIMDTRYFECASGHGIFVRPSQIQAAPKKAVRSAPSSAKTQKPTSPANKGPISSSSEKLNEISNTENKENILKKSSSNDGFSNPPTIPEEKVIQLNLPNEKSQYLEKIQEDVPAPKNKLPTKLIIPEEEEFTGLGLTNHTKLDRQMSTPLVFNSETKSPVKPNHPNSLVLHDIETLTYVEGPNSASVLQRTTSMNSTTRLPSPTKKRPSTSFQDVNYMDERGRTGVRGELNRKSSGSTSPSKLPLSSSPVRQKANIPQAFTSSIDFSHHVPIVEAPISVLDNAVHSSSRSPIEKEHFVKSPTQDSQMSVKVDFERNTELQKLQQKCDYLLLSNEKLQAQMKSTTKQETENMRAQQELENILNATVAKNDSLMKALDELQLRYEETIENEKKLHVAQQNLELKLSDSAQRERQLLQEHRELKIRLEDLMIHEKEREQEIHAMQELVQDHSGKDSLQMAFNMLQVQHEAMKVELANNRTRFEQSIQKEGDYIAEIAKLKAELDKRHDELEISLLDKCIAEERSEELHTQVNLLNERVEELTIELDLAKENISAVGEEPGSSKNHNQLLLQNERLALALIKLREITSAKEAELLEELESSKSQTNLYSEMNAEDRIKYLKAQLDDTDSATEVVQALTDRNLKLDEALVKKKLDLMELEQLRTINNELEMAHVDLERHLYEECDVKEKIIQELILRYQKQKMQLFEANAIIEKLKIDANNNVRPSLNNTPSEVELADIKRKLGLSEIELHKMKVNLDLKSCSLTLAEHKLSVYKGFLDNNFHNLYGNAISAVYGLKSIASDISIVQRHLHMDKNMSEFVEYTNVLYEIIQLSRKLVWAVEGCTNDEEIVRFGNFNGSIDTISNSSKSLIVQYSEEGSFHLKTLNELRSVLNQLRSISDNSGFDFKVVADNLHFKSSHLSFELEQIVSIIDLHHNIIASIKKNCSDEVKPAIFTFTLKAEHSLEDMNTLCTNIQSRLDLSWKTSKVLKSNAVDIGKLRPGCVVTLQILSNVKKALGADQMLTGESIENILKESSINSLFDKLESTRKEIKKVLEIALEKESFEDANEAKLSWDRTAELLKAENISGRELKVKNEQLESKLMAQMQEEVKKDDLIGQYTVSIELMENKLKVLDKLKSECKTLETKLEEVSKSEALFKEAMQALHEDFTLSEAENEKLREHCRKLESRMAIGSPIRKAVNSDQSMVIQSSSVGNPEYYADQMEIQRTCIRFLMMENARLKGLEYSSIALDLFHPSDPLTKRAQREEGRNSSKDEKMQNMLDLNRLARKLTTEAYLFGAGSTVVDLSGTVKKTNGWKPQILNPQFQWLSKKKQLEEMFENIQQISDAVQNFRHSSVLQNPLSRKLLALGVVEIPSKLRKSKSIVKVSSRSQFQTIHSLLAK